jgi:DNA invertase Pin-like site-specific DNA recombinase
MLPVFSNIGSSFYLFRQQNGSTSSTPNQNQGESMNKKVALYARVSTADQTSGLEAQMRTLKEFCERNSIVDYEFFTDENQSGAKVSRPSLDRMMIAVRNGEISKVVVYSFSRFARSTTHLLTALEEFRERQVDFISMTEQIQTDLSKHCNRCQSFTRFCFGRARVNEA